MSSNAFVSSVSELAARSLKIEKVEIAEVFTEKSKEYIDLSTGGMDLRTLPLHAIKACSRTIEDCESLAKVLNSVKSDLDRNVARDNVLRLGSALTEISTTQQISGNDDFI